MDIGKKGLSLIFGAGLFLGAAGNHAMRMPEPEPVQQGTFSQGFIAGQADERAHCAQALADELAECGEDDEGSAVPVETNSQG